MDDKITTWLSASEVDENHASLLKHVMNLVDMSRAKMSCYYADWDRRHDSYRFRRTLDKEDVQSMKHKEPVKMVTPMTYAQIDTFVSFNLMLLGQKKYLYEVESVGNEDLGKENPVELLLNNDMKYSNQWNLLNQLFLDLGKFGLGCVKNTWEIDKTFVPKQIEVAPATFVGGNETQPAKTATTWIPVIRRKGNKVVNVSPYRVFPDTRLPLTRYQEGEFVATEDVVNKNELKRLQALGEVAGVEHISQFASERIETRRSSRLPGVDLENKACDMLCKTEVIVDLIPKEWKFANDQVIGNEDFPVRYVITYVNDQRIVSIKPLGALTKRFPVYIAQFSPDMHELIGTSIAELLKNLQHVQDFLINSRITSVKRTIDNQLVVDPSGVDMATIESRSRVIKLSKNAGARGGIDRFVKQLQVQDVTANHLRDIDYMEQMGQKGTGVNDNALGQYHSGRRSATEARSVTQGASARLKACNVRVWEMVMGPLGEDMIINLRQGLDIETWTKIVGTQDPQLFETFQGTPESLVQSNDLLIYDGSLPSEKGYLAQVHQELLAIILTNPQAAVQFNINPKKVLDEIYKLRGIGNISKFGFTQEELIQQTIQNMINNGQLSGAGQTNPGGVQGATQ